jgi:RNA polymerase sigma factor (sigma-70 family)
MTEQVSDTILLERFVNRREEAAFAALVQRHGPVVAGICRRLLRNEHDAEDVFQATFVVLARKAAQIPWRGSIGGWLCAVARRLARSTRADISRYQRREIPLIALGRPPQGGTNDHELSRRPLRDKPGTLPDPALEVERRDLCAAIDDELLQLPEKYRAPLILCYMEGKTHREAAQALGWPAGSVSRRMERARLLLRNRLASRGVSLAVGLLALSFAALSAWSVTPNRRQNPPVLWQAAASPLRPPAHDKPAIDELRARIGRGEVSLESSQVAALARQLTALALRLEAHDPGPRRDDWRAYSLEMHHSARELARASEQGDSVQMVAAARRLDAACVKCHEAFRPWRRILPPADG